MTDQAIPVLPCDLAAEKTADIIGSEVTPERMWAMIATHTAEPQDFIDWLNVRSMDIDILPELLDERDGLRDEIECLTAKIARYEDQKQATERNTLEAPMIDERCTAYVQAFNSSYLDCTLPEGHTGQHRAVDRLAAVEAFWPAGLAQADSRGLAVEDRTDQVIAQIQAVKVDALNEAADAYPASTRNSTWHATRWLRARAAAVGSVPVTPKGPQ